VLAELARDRTGLERVRKQGMAYARERLTWDSKAQDTTRVLRWVTGQGPKPDFRPPKVLTNDVESPSRNAAPFAGTPALRKGN